MKKGGKKGGKKDEGEMPTAAQVFELCNTDEIVDDVITKDEALKCIKDNAPEEF